MLAHRMIPAAEEQRPVVMIIDRDGPLSRILSLDASGYHEASLADLDAFASQVLARQPDLILVNPGALSLSGEPLVDELNRLVRFHPRYKRDDQPEDVTVA